jgi:hypothetical protein
MNLVVLLAGSIEDDEPNKDDDRTGDEEDGLCVKLVADNVLVDVLVVNVVEEKLEYGLVVGVFVYDDWDNDDLDDDDLVDGDLVDDDLVVLDADLLSDSQYFHPG